jgi:GntR family transcriptional regulator / MocR family aminotransferase
MLKLKVPLIDLMKSICADLVLQRMPSGDATPFNRRLYDCLRTAILDRSLPPKSALPASRELARELEVSRNTVLDAYEQLRAEGYITSLAGSGTFVATTAPEAFLTTRNTPARSKLGARDIRFALRARPFTSEGAASTDQWGAFMPGVPDVTEFPSRQYSRILSGLWRSPAPELLTYAHGGGHLALRTAITEHLRIARSVRCDPEQVLITEGVHQAIDLCVRMLVDHRDPVWVEEPGYWGFHKVLQMCEAQIKPMAVDDGYLWPHLGSPPRLIFVTPSHQYPLGTVMPLNKRRELLDYARSCGAWIIEDDYDSEFRFSGRPIPAMQGLEEDSPVIYIGTFSKTLYPGLRVAFMVLPQGLAAAFKTAHSDLYRQGHTITQLALSSLIENGHFATHIRRMRIVYARRRAILEALITLHLGAGRISESSSKAGLHLVLRLPDGIDDVAISTAAQSRGILTRPLSKYYLNSPRRGLLLGYACVPNDRIEPAFLALKECLPRSMWKS